MASAFGAPNLQRPCNFQWCWNSASNPWSEEDEEWQMYTYDKNKIIHDAFNNGKTQVDIDEDHMVDLEYMLQYDKIDGSNARQIKRVPLERDRRHIYPRKERFSSSIPIVDTTSLIQESDLEEDTLEHLRKYGDFPDAYYEQELQNEEKSVADVIDQAIEGILQEGMSQGKEEEARELSEQLLKVRHFGTDVIADRFNIPREVGETCVRLYTGTGFWYRLINRVCRNPGNITREKIKTLGPFCYLLELYLMTFSTNDIQKVYRGVDLTDEQRQEFMKKEIIFKSFTSTSANRKVAEMYKNNTLLIIDLNVKHPELHGHIRRGADISSLSQIPDEEEFLIWPSAEFTFVRCEYDSKSNTSIIYLKSAEEK